MEYLWAPWRMEYILSEKTTGCLFCQKLTENTDTKNYILFRADHGFVMMNYFPYNNGHLMIVPYRHVANLTDLNQAEQTELIALVCRCQDILLKAMKPEGFNIGMNLGKIAGAGVEEHLHFHIVPRWNGDTNFMPITGHTKVMPQGLNESYAILKPLFLNP